MIFIPVCLQTRQVLTIKSAILPRVVSDGRTVGTVIGGITGIVKLFFLSTIYHSVIMHFVQSPFLHPLLQSVDVLY